MGWCHIPLQSAIRWRHSCYGPAYYSQIIWALLKFSQCKCWSRRHSSSSLYALPMYEEICKRTVNFIKSCLNSDCVLVNRLTYSLRTNAVTYRQKCTMYGKRYSEYNINKIDNSTVQHWYESNISEELRSNVLLLSEMIFSEKGLFTLVLTMLVFVLVTIAFRLFLIFALNDCFCLIIALFSAK